MTDAFSRESGDVFTAEDGVEALTKRAKDLYAQFNDAVAKYVSDVECRKGLGDLGDSTVTELKTIQSEGTELVQGFETNLERVTAPYVMSDRLRMSVNIAMSLGKPLLLEGEPGTGKTALAYAIAGEGDFELIHVACKSTSEARALVYEIDVLQRLQDAHLGVDVSDLSKYVREGPIGRALSADKQILLLVDEVDKTSREFANDLLDELDKMSFVVDEIGQRVKGKIKPIVVITSNHERSLPPAFLRRCIYDYIEFPEVDQMSEIVTAHYPDVETALLESALSRFYEIRNSDKISKKPSTSELLDWIAVLTKFGVHDVNTHLPYLQALLKTQEDQAAFEGNKSLEEQYRANGMPLEFIAAVGGNKVVNLRQTSSGGQNLTTYLANSGIPFVSRTRERKFAIKSPGAYALEGVNDWMVLPEPLYKTLSDNGFVGGEVEVVMPTEPVKFKTVSDSNELYTVGTNENRQEIYRLADGRVAKIVFHN